MSPRLIALLPFLLLLLLAGCGGGGAPDPTADPGCTANLVFGVQVSLRDIGTGAPVTGATLALRDGTYLELLQETLPGRYLGAEERAGVYRLTVTATGYEDATRDPIVVTAGPCHVDPVEETIALTPR